MLACGHRAPPPGKPDVTPPQVNLIRPPEGALLRPNDTVAFVLEVTDSSEVVRAVVRINDRVVVADSTPPLELLWIVDTAVFHPTAETLQLTLEVWDYWDNVARVSRKVVVKGVRAGSSTAGPASQEEKDAK